MAGMLRFKDEEEFKKVLKGAHVRVHSDTRGRVSAVDCRYAGPGAGLCDQCAKGRYDKCRYVAAATAGGKPASNPARSATRADSTASGGSEIEELLAGQISAVGNLPAPIREYPFLRGRAHRLDFAWPDWTVNGMQLGLEVQGMAHRIKSKFSADLEKRALGMLQGWLILEVGGDHIRSGKAMEWLQELFTKAERRP